MVRQILVLGLLLWTLLAFKGWAQEDHLEHRVLKLSPETVREFGIQTRKAALREFPRIVELPGEVVLDPDREAHVVPPVRGFVRQVFKRWGDRVEAGEVVAVIDSPELADLKSSYLQAKARWRLAQELFKREKALWEKKITAEESYLKAKQAVELAHIQVKSLEQKLKTLGFSPQSIQKFETGDQPLGRYELKAPISGIIVAKHLSPGEMVGPERVAFQIADLSVVWALISVYREWLPYVKEGRKVKLILGKGFQEKEGIIDYVNPVLKEGTRSAQARVILKNPSRELKPGLFLKALVPIGKGKKVVAVPEGAVQYVGHHPVIFIKTSKGFLPREVEVGERFGGLVEIRKGLSPGEEYVVAGAFTLKAEIEKEAFGEGHVH